jgi:hypothetical protein
MEEVFLKMSQSAMSQTTYDGNSRYDPKHTSLIVADNPPSSDSEDKKSKDGQKGGSSLDFFLRLQDNSCRWRWWHQ